MHTSWSTEASQVVRASRETIWRLWSDVERWSDWDEQVAWSKIDGPFAVGTRGKLKPKSGPASKFELLDVRPGEAFADRTFLPGTFLDFTHRLEEVEGGVRITHTASFSGPLAFLFSRIIGRAKIAAALPRAVTKLAALAEAAR